MTSWKQRVNYDLIAHVYDEPGRDYEADANLIEFLNEKNGCPFAGVRVLDLGCGTGKQLAADQHKFADLAAVGLDLFHGMLLQARQRCAGIDWVQGDSAEPPFPTESFDYITSQFAYHHVQDKNRMVASIFRILKPGGRFVITNLDPWSMPGWIVYTYFPTSRGRDQADFLPLDHLTALLQATGFAKIRVQHEHSSSQENLCGFLQYASQRHCTSQLMAIPDGDYADGIAQLEQHVKTLGREAWSSSEISLVRVTGDKPG